MSDESGGLLPSPDEPPHEDVPRRSSYMDVGSHADTGSSEIVLSTAAYRLHLYAVMDSLVAGHEDFIADSYLAERATPAEVVRELVVFGYWHRADGGYRIEDERSVDVVGNIYVTANRIAESCIDGRGHLVDPTNPGVCAVCHTPLGLTDDDEESPPGLQ